MAIKIPAIERKEIHYKYVDGVKIVIVGSDTTSIRAKAYLKAKEITPPVIIPSPNDVRELTIFDLKNFNGVDKGKFTIKPGVITDRIDFKDVQNISIDGLGKVQFQTGMRAIQFNGAPPSGVKLNGLSFKDINDYCVDFWAHGSNPSSNPTKGFEFTNMKAENCGTIFHIDGDLEKGLIEDLIIQNLTFINSKQPRSVVYVGNGKNYSVSNCLVDNVNYERNFYEHDQLVPNGTHNGVFQMGGWGKFFKNKITNYQGNALRSWLFSHSKDFVGTVEAFDNIFWNTIKYSGIEIQNRLGSPLPCNAKIYNNTVGKMNTSGDWEGQILDLYNFNGRLDFYNNLGFELNRVGKPTTDMINANGESSLVGNMSGNKYFDKWQDAVKDLTNFESKINGVGASL